MLQPAVSTVGFFKFRKLFCMKLEYFVATVKHNQGRVKMQIISLTGIDGAIASILAAEGCPRSAIKSIKPQKFKV